MSWAVTQPVDGALPSTVFTRWIYRVTSSLSPSVGPFPTTTASRSNHGIAPGATKLGSEVELRTWPHTMLESRECCHAGLGSRLYGVGLRKCVSTCSPSALNSVACGPNVAQRYTEPVATQT